MCTATMCMCVWVSVEEVAVRMQRDTLPWLLILPRFPSNIVWCPWCALPSDRREVVGVRCARWPFLVAKRSAFPVRMLYKHLDAGLASFPDEWNEWEEWMEGVQLVLRGETVRCCLASNWITDGTPRKALVLHKPPFSLIYDVHIQPLGRFW